MPQAGFDRDEARIWLEQLHGDSEGFIQICSVGNFAGATVDLSNSDWTSKALHYIENLHNSGTQGIYLRATTIGRRLEKGERGGVKDTKTFPGFWADIDLKGPGHKHEVCTTECTKTHRHKTLDLPETEAEARRVLETSGLPEPTLWIHSGGGLYPWWLLDKPLAIDADNLEGIQKLSEMWQRVIGATFERHGLEYGTGVHDLARVLRIPGTVNRKTDQDRPCRILEGNSGRMYSIQELDEVLAPLGRALEPEQLPIPVAPRPSVAGSGTSPLDDFEARTDWADILIPFGWTFDKQMGQTRYWVRPGKDRRDGHSATTGHAADRDRMWVFSTDVLELEAQKEHTKQYVYAAYNHAGDMSAAAKSLRDKGYGSPVMVTMDAIEPAPFITDQVQMPPGHEVVIVAPEQVQVPRLDAYPHTDRGNAQRLLAMFPGRFRYCNDRRKWAVWDGRRWDFKFDSDMIKSWVGQMSEYMAKQADDLGEEGKALMKWARQTGNDSRQNSAVAQLRTMVPSMSTDYDVESRYLNIHNGILNLDTGELLPHDQKYMLTKMFGASYRPEATAPRWRQFLEEVLPDEATRDFIQRMAGYSLLGKPNRRAMALLSGPPGTGKSKFVEALTKVFGEYGGTAAASLLRAKKGDNTSTLELHALRGKRFVATSESAEDAKLDEELIKRLSGQDSVTSRGHYEELQSWDPQAVMWMATNHNPRINPDDPAAWGRVKVIEFDQRFEGSTGEDPELLDKLLAEADGILNWLLEGLAKFREQGVEAPQAVKDAGEKYRTENDTALQFMEIALDQEQIVLTKGAEITKQMLYERYKAWCGENFRPLGHIKFNKRVKAQGYEDTKRGGQVYWLDMTINPMSGLLGHMSG